MLTSFNDHVHLKTLHNTTIKRKKINIFKYFVSFYTIFPREQVIKDGTSKEYNPKTALQKYICRIVMIVP